MTKIDDLHRRWSKDADYNAAYDALGERFDVARSLIEAKTMVRLSPSQHAKKGKMRVVHRANRPGSARPSIDPPQRFAPGFTLGSIPVCGCVSNRGQAVDGAGLWKW